MVNSGSKGLIDDSHLTTQYYWSISRIRWALREKPYITPLAIFLDFSKAFITLAHEIII